MTVSLSYAVSQILILDRLGFPKAKAFDMLGLKIENHQNPLKRLPAKNLNDLFSKVAEIMQDPYIALKVGNEFRIGNFGETGKIYNFCENMIEVLDVNASYQPLAVDIAKITPLQIDETETGETRYFVDFAPYLSDINDILHVFYLVIGAYGTTFRWITWNSARDLKAVYLQLPQPEDDQLHKTIFKCPVYFDQPYNRIEFYEDSMLETLSTHDPVRKAQCMAILDDLIKSDTASTSFKDSLRVTIIQGIDTGQYSLPLLADKLNMSEQKLKNKLKGENIKYRDFLEHVRKDLFIEKHNAGMSFTQIALDLGYSDQAAFSKAFKRWYGMSPTTFKQENKTKTVIDT